MPYLFLTRILAVIFGVSLAVLPACGPAPSASGPGPVADTVGFVCPPPLENAAPVRALPPDSSGNYYSKWIDAEGIPVRASRRACDRSLQVAARVVEKMLSFRPDIRARLIGAGASVAVLAFTEKLTDLPEEHDLAGSWTDAGHTRKFDGLCGGGGVPGRPTVVCEQNLLGQQDPYRNRMSVLIHEFGHTIQNEGIDPTLAAQIQRVYAQAQARQLFPGLVVSAGPAPASASLLGAGSAAVSYPVSYPVSYMMNNPQEFFAEATCTWFNAADPTNPANSPDEKGREYLSEYDPELYQLLSWIYPADSWEYRQADTDNPLNSGL